MSQSVQLPQLKTTTNKQNSRYDSRFQTLGSQLAASQNSGNHNNSTRLRTQQEIANQYNKKDLRKFTSVLPLSELERIKSNSMTHIYDSTQHQENKQKQNSIWAERIKRDYDKKKQAQYEKFAKKEEELRLIDLKEEQIRQDLRKQVLFDANQKIFDNQENVRALKRQLLYSDNLQEQQRLQEVKKMIEDKKKVQDQYFVEEERLRMAKEDEKIQQEEYERLKKKEQARQMINQQVIDAKELAIQKYQNDKIEGELMREQAEEAIQKEKQKQLEIRLKHQQLVKEMKEAQREQVQRKKDEREKERIEDEKIEREKLQKETVQRLKEERHKFMAERIRKQRQKMIDEGIKRLNEFKSNEEQRITNQIKEAEVKKEQQEKQKQAKKDQLKKDIDDSLKISIAKKQILQKEQAEKDKVYMDTMMENYKTLNEMDKQEKVYQRQKEREIKEYNLQQIQDKRQRKKQQLIDDIDEDIKIRQSMEMDKRVFNSWAEDMITQWKDDGKNVNPVLRNLGKIQQVQ